MSARCPKCSDRDLRHAVDAVTSNLDSPPLHCDHCGGIWLGPKMVERLAETGLLEQIDSTDTSRREEDKRTGICPDGHGIMTRAKVSAEEPFYLERCSRCGGTWFDAGEWNRLASMNLLDHLDDLWSRKWRREKAAVARAEATRSDLLERFGPEALEKIDAVGQLLAAHPDGAMGLAYLSELVRRAGSRT